MKTRPTRWLKAALPIFALASPALAQEPSQPIRLEHLSPEQVLAIAARLIAEGQLDGAQSLLDRLAADGVGGVEREFLTSMVAMARKDYRLAESQLRNMLAGDPNLVRVRLELARSLFFQKKDEDADYHFKLAIAQKPPEAVIKNIARFREAIRVRRAWRVNITLGIAPDSNISSATDKETVDIFGLPFQLDPSARARSGIGLIVGGDASIRLWRERKVPLYLAAYGRATLYSGDEFDDIYVGAEAGPEFKLDGGRLRVSVTGLHRWYGGQALVTSLGGRLNFDKVIGGKLALEATLAVRRNDYARRDDVDGWDIEASLSANRALGPSTLGFAYGSVQRSFATDPENSNWQGRIGVGILKEIGWGLRPQISLEVGHQVNDAPSVLFGTTRRDWHLQASASIYKRDWSVMGFAPSLRVTYTRGFSTIPLYDQRRVRAEFGIAKAL
jgi:hypothetical protein